MKTRYLAVLAGILALAAVAPASAHERTVRLAAAPQLSGGVSLWGGSYGPAGWSGSLSIGVPIVRGPVYAAPVILTPPAWHHAPRARHGVHHSRGHAYEKAWRKGYAEGRRDAGRHGRKHGYYD